MPRKKFDQQTHLEIAIILLSLGLCCLLYKVGPYRLVVLNLFYLPVVLAAFYLGRYRAGILALLCVICAGIVVALDLNTTSSVFASPLVMGLALTIWGGVMGINSLLVGTLSDEKMTKIQELHDAYVGVVEVLARYLNSADPKARDHTAQVAQISQEVAARMRLSAKEIDDIRVAALLQGMENIEVTAKVIRKAVGNLAQPTKKKQPEHTFHGSELVQSLGAVLTGALPLLGEHRDDSDLNEKDGSEPAAADRTFGSHIIHTVREYVTLLHEAPSMNSRKALAALASGLEGDHHPAVVHALEQVVIRWPDLSAGIEDFEPVLAGQE